MTSVSVPALNCLCYRNLKRSNDLLLVLAKTIELTQTAKAWPCPQNKLHHVLKSDSQCWRVVFHTPHEFYVTIRVYPCSYGQMQVLV